MRFQFLVSLLALIAAQEARAFILEFNVPDSGTIYTTAEVDGFLITGEHFHLRADGVMASNGTTHLDYEAGRGRPFTISRVGGGTFSLLDFVGAEGVAEDPEVRPAADAIGVVGYRADGTTVSAQFRLDGIHDGAAAGSANDFQPFTLPEGFNNLTSVLFYDLRDDGRDGGIAVDNLNIDTGAPPSDTVAPAVSITSPAGGTVLGTVLLSTAATDASGVVGVQYKVDGVNLGMEVLASPYSLPWDTTTVTDGVHTITATARDRHNNFGTSSPVVVTVVNGSVGGVPYYLNFDGVDDYVEVADSDSVSFGNGATDTPLTFELWFRPGSMTSKQNLLTKWGSGSAVREYRLYIATGTIRLDLMDGARQAQVSARSDVNLTSLAGGWHHLAVTYDGRGGATAAGGITIYVDGVPVPMFRVNNASYVAMSNTSAIVQIGRESGLTNQFNGGLDEIRLWNVARSPAEIQASMSSELAGTESGLQAYWKLNDGATIVTDSSSSGNVGTLRNNPAWASGGPMTPPVVDVTPPQISSIATGDITDTGVTITFTTDEPATGSVSYTTNGICPCGEVSGPGGRTAHSIRLSGLSPDTLYAFAAKAVDAAGNATTAATLTFTTSAPLPDTTAPTVSITSPATGTVAGTINLAATATDASGVAGVQFKVDGVNLGAEDLSSPYAIAWDTTTVANGTHTITVEARDAVGNVGTSSLVVTVSNGMTGSDPYYLSFDGVDDYVDLADSDSLSFGNGAADTPLTFELWFRPGSMTPNQNLLTKWGSSGSTREYRLFVSSGTIRLELMDRNGQARVWANTTGNLSSLAGGWHHLAVTYDGRGGATAAGGITIYVDGVAVPVNRVNNAAYVAMNNTAALLQIGREAPASRQYAGGLDEIRLWNVARSPAEIQASMSSELAGTESGLQAYWKLNDGGGGVIEDSSPSANVGTLRNGPTWSYGGGFAP